MAPPLHGFVTAVMRAEIEPASAFSLELQSLTTTASGLADDVAISGFGAGACATDPGLGFDIDLSGASSSTSRSSSPRTPP